jgi:hypothetical protein
MREERREGSWRPAEPRRKPKHFEICGKDAAGDLVELHVDLRGALRKTRLAKNDNPQCTVDLRKHS